LSQEPYLLKPTPSLSLHLRHGKSRGATKVKVVRSRLDDVRSHAAPEWTEMHSFEPVPELEGLLDDVVVEAVGVQ